MIQNPINCDGQGASLSQDYKIELDITPQSMAPTWAELRAGISQFSHSTNDNIDQTQYMDGDGYGSSNVTGAQYRVNISGDRIIGDPAQDFIFSRAFDVGCKRKTNCRITDPAGNVVQNNVTIANISLPGGSAGAKASFSFEIHFNGKPDSIPASETAVTGVTLSADTLSIAPGNQSILKVNIAPEIAANKEYTVISSKPNDVMVSKDGQYVAVRVDENATPADTATITVTTAQGNFTATCTVTVA